MATNPSVTARFRIIGPVASVKEYVSVSTARKSVQVFISNGTGQQAYRVDTADPILMAELPHIATGTRVLASGRIYGKLNDRGFMNYSLWADECYPIPPSAAQTEPKPAAADPQYSTDCANEDYPF